MKPLQNCYGFCKGFAMLERYNLTIRNKQYRVVTKSDNNCTVKIINIQEVIYE